VVELEEAKQPKIRVLNWQKEHCGMDHPDTYKGTGNLAKQLGELGKAKQLEIQVLNRRKEHLWMDHPGTYRATGSLAQIGRAS
jgi:hypothetical protein